MDKHLVLTDPTLLAAIVGGTAAVGVAAFNFTWSSFRKHTQRLEIVDMANKRAEFWARSLTIQLVAADHNSYERKHVKQKARQALHLIESQANDQLKELAWKGSTRKKIKSVGPFKVLKPAPGQAPGGYSQSQLRWVLVKYILMTSVGVSLTGAAIYLQWHREANWALGTLFFVAFAQLFYYLAASLLWDAEMSKYEPRPAPIVLDEV